MPIRFRCAYCNQLMGIARRKAGQVVKCPKCAGEIIVPVPEGTEQPEATEQPGNHGGAFEDMDFDPAAGPPPLDSAASTAAANSPAEPTAPPPPPTPKRYGVFLSIGTLCICILVVILLFILMFVLGMIVGKQTNAPPDSKSARALGATFFLCAAEK
jgi:phage FluMu protein Com